MKLYVVQIHNEFLGDTIKMVTPSLDHAIRVAQQLAQELVDYDDVMQILPMAEGVVHDYPSALAEFRYQA